MSDAVGVVLAIGFALGWTSAFVGVGAGLSLPMLAVLGVSLPQALLAVKLPVVASDAAVVADRSMRARDARRAAWRAWPQLVAGGAGGAALTLYLPTAWLVYLIGVLGLLHVLERVPRRREGRFGPGLWLWPVYVGAFGAGSGAFCIARQRRLGAAWSDAVLFARHAGAAANAGAVAVLVPAFIGELDRILWLAGGQFVGAYIAQVMRRGGSAARARMTAPHARWAAGRPATAHRADAAE